MAKVEKKANGLKALAVALIMAALLPFAAQAQFVTLTGKLNAANGVPFANGVINFTPSQTFFVPNSNTTQLVGNLLGSGAPANWCLIESQLYTDTSLSTPPASRSS